MLAGTLNLRSGMTSGVGAGVSGEVRTGSSSGPWIVTTGSVPSTCWPVVSSLQRRVSSGRLNWRLKTVQARRLKSQATQRRFSFSAATAAVAQPAKQSSTTSPSFDEARMIRSNSETGFWVG